MASGQAGRLQKEELRRELAEQREIAREAKRVLDAADGAPDPSTLRRASELLTAIDRGATMRPAADRFLFITGCPRSGTSAILLLLNSDPRIALGLERFKYIRDRLEPRHFSREYFLNPTPDETNIFHPELYRELRRKLDDGGVQYIGDKLLTQGDGSMYERAAREFPESRYLYMFRGLEAVATSYNRRAANPDDVNWPADHDYRRAVRVWNRSLRALHEFAAGEGAADRILVISYERLFAGDLDYLRSVYRFLELDLVPEMELAFRLATRDWEERVSNAEALDSEMRDHLEQHRNAKLERMATAMAEHAGR